MGRSFILSRPSRRKLKQSGILKERVFGCDLGEHLLNSGRDIPMVLKCCGEFIEEYGIVDGIYRLSGVTSNIQKLRNAFDEDRVPALVEDEAIRQDMHAVSSLLKMYFRELPNPLCTYQLYGQFVDAVQQPDHLRVLRMREVVQQLPPPHYRTLEYLTRHLARVAENSASTGMTAKNVAIVWAPNLLRCKELEFGGVAALQGVGVQAVVTECLVRYVELIFSDKLPSVATINEPASGASGPGALKRTRPKSLAISTPTKLLSLEEARNRALQLATAINDTHYIEVGGGPASLPPKYHTVIDLPGGDHRKRGNSLKHKKSPIGWKSLFVKGRTPSASSTSSNKAQRKGSSASTGSTASMPAASTSTQRAVTYIRPKLRPVKSAESLVAQSNRNSTADEHLSGAEAMPPGTDEVSQLEPTSRRSQEKIKEEDATDSADDDGQLSRCHSRSVSHDSYFRLLVNNKPLVNASHDDDLPLEDGEQHVDQQQQQESSFFDDVIYAEISKSSIKNCKDQLEPVKNQTEEGTEFGKNFDLPAIEEPNDYPSHKNSMNDLSHLDDGELNLMGSREMLAITKKAIESSNVKPRQASIDDSVIDNSTRGFATWDEISRCPVTNQPNKAGEWAANNPAYELFCIQAEVHHGQRQTPSPDNTEAQVPDMPSEMAMDGDNDSLANLCTEDYSPTEINPLDQDSYTPTGGSKMDDVYENVNVSDIKTLTEIERTSHPEKENSYENCVDDANPNSTYENVIEANDAAIIDEEYEPIETSNMADACYENVDQPQASYENIDQPQASYENIDQPQANYENIDQPQASYENIDNQLVDDDVAGVYENVNVYEDVVPPPPTSTETEEIVYHQVKFFRKSVQEVNELLEKNVTDVVPANVTPVSVAGVVDVVPQRDTTTSDRTSIKTNTPAHSVNDRKPTKPMKPATSTTSATSKSDASPIETTNQKDAMSLSLPSLSSSSSKLAQLAATTSKLFQSHPQPQEKHSEPLKHIENDSITSKRRLESEIGRDLLRERRTRNEIQNSRRSESNLSSTAAPIIQVLEGRRQTTSESSSLKPIKPPFTSSPLKKIADSRSRPTTLETSFDYDSSSISPLSPKTPSPEARNGSTSSTSSLPRFGCERQTSVKELLNKFQSTEERRSVATPTSPIKPTSPTSPEEITRNQEINKKKDDKENIDELNLIPLDASLEIPVDVKDVKDVKDEAKDTAVIRQKSLNVSIDMSDPRTRLRIERYKEERRSFLREKYKSESFRSSGDTKDDDIIVRLKQKAGSPTRSSLPDAPQPIEEVNVKERAAQWTHSRVSGIPASNLPATGLLTATTPIHLNKVSHRSCSDTVVTPNKRIRDMAAMFEKESP